MTKTVPKYIVQRSARRKLLRITVERDRRVVVHAPLATSEADIVRIVESRRRWILDKQSSPQKYKELPHPPGKELANGEAALYLGHAYRVRIVSGALSNPKIDGDLLVPQSLVSAGCEVLKNWYVTQAKEVIPPRAQLIALGLGVSAKVVRIVNSRMRWGSCTPKGTTTFNWRLIKAPMYVVDYVIVHELAHLREANHTTAFWNIVRTHAPKADKARNWLTENGHLLEEQL